MGNVSGGGNANLALLQQFKGLKKSVEIIGKIEVIGITSVKDMDNPGVETGKLKIYYGIIDGTAYISLDARWIRLQFKFSGGDNTFTRVVYGGSAPSEWKKI